QALLRDVVTSAERRARYLSAGLWDDATLAGRVALHAGQAPDALAVVDERGRYSYEQLAGNVGAVAAALAERGVEVGSVVSIQLPNRYEAVVAAVAVQSLGAVINPLLPNYRVKELTDVFTRAKPRVVLTPAEYRGFDHRVLVGEACDRSGVAVHHVVVDGEPETGATAYQVLEASGGERFGPGRSADAVSELIFTSGTEASPKAIMHTEQTANFSVRVAYADLGVAPGDVVWMPSPVGHSTGFNYGVRFALYHRLPLVLQDRWE